MRALFFVLLLAACTAPPAPAKENAPPPRPLAGTRWVLELEGVSRAAPTLEFRDAGRATGFTGCNEWFAQVDRSGGGLRFSAIGVTRRGCEPRAMQIERDFASQLERTRAAEVEEDALVLTDEDGKLVARFQRAR